MGLHIGLNGAFVEHPATGSGQYLGQILSRLADGYRGHRYQLLLARPHPAYASGRVCVPGWLPGKQPRKVFQEQVGVPLAALSGRLDVVHYPYFAAPLVSPAKTVVTVHDVIPLVLPGYRGSPLVRVYMALAATATRRAAAIICDSRHSQADAIRTLKVPAERTKVIYLAPDPGLRPVDAATAAAVRRHYSLGERFFFYVGGLDRRKNLGVLLRAFAEVAAKHPEAQLAIAGQAAGTSALFPDWRGMAAALGLGDQVRFLGHVSEGDKALLYGAALAFTFPSLYEGFGLPPLEALACGTPVLCADASSLPEVVGEAAILLPPADVRAWGEALRRAWEDGELRKELREKGLAQAAAFSWERTVRETVEVYECVS
ncbi:MAG: glycosyltransferase family 1 protein [Dehalococcoidales bacterium]|nr:glycosyltransferase family 1 protein [Dehalococcoidales bacterium]